MSASLLLERLARFHPAPQNDKYFDLVGKKQLRPLPTPKGIESGSEIIDHPSAPPMKDPAGDGVPADRLVLCVETIKREALAEAERTYLQSLEQLIDMVFAKLLPETLTREILSILDHSSQLQLSGTIRVCGAPAQIEAIQTKLAGREDLLARLRFEPDPDLSQSVASVSWEAGGIEFNGEQILAQCRDAIRASLEQKFEQE